MKTCKVLTGVAVFAVLGIAVSAHANMLVNGGLEVSSGQLAADPSLMYPDGLIHASQTIHSGALNGWTISGASIDVVPNTYWQATEGTYSVDLVGTTGIGGISQTVSGLTPGDMYELSFDFAVNPSNGGHGGESSFIKWLHVGITNSSLPDFYFAGTPSGTQTATNLEYVRRGIVFTATDTTTTIMLNAVFPSTLPAFFPDGTPVTADALYTGPVVDNVDLEDLMPQGGGQVAQLPEPGSLAALSISGLMLLRRRR